jgi:predicted aspartyl protease
MKRLLAAACALSTLWSAALAPATEVPANAIPANAVPATATSLAPVEPPTPIVETDTGPEFATPTTLDQIGRIVAPVMINGRGPFKLMVDTGANRSLITTVVAETLGIDYASAPLVTMNGVTGAAEVPAVAIDRLEAGELVFEGMQVPVLPPHLVGGADGILGIAGLREQRLVVDFDNDRVTISRSKLWETSLLRIDAHRVAGGLLAAKGRVGRIKVLAVMDTGGQITLGNRALQEALRSQAKTQTEVLGTTETVIMGDTARVPDIRFGEVSIRRVRVTFGDFHIFDVWDLNDEPALIIGMDVLGAMGAFMIDFRLAQIHLRG